MRLALFAACLLVVGTSAGTAWAQGAADPAAKPGTDAPPRPRTVEEDREQVKARLTRRQEDLARIQQRIQQAIERLDAGAALDEVRQLADRPGDRPGDRGPGERDGRRGPGGRERGAGDPNDGGPPATREGGPPDDRGMDRERTLAFVREHLPELWERIEQARQRGEEDHERMIGRLMPRLRELMAERDERVRDARIAEFRHGQTMFTAAFRYGELVRGGSPEAEQAAAKAELRTLVGKQFDLRIARHQAEIASLEDRLARLRKDVEEQTSRRDEVIDDGVKRFDERAREPRREGGDRSPDRTPGQPPGRP
ncbi:MAG: hypothetical protein ACKVU4_01465 [Phycisphaerales bacterium]